MTASQDFEYIIRELYFSDSELTQLQQKVLQVTDVGKVQLLIDEMEITEQTLTAHIQLAPLPWLHILTAHCCAHHWQLNHVPALDNAIRFARMSVHGFAALFSHTYNQALCCWYLGLLHAERGEIDEAKFQFFEAEKLLTALGISTSSRYENRPLIHQYKQALRRSRQELNERRKVVHITRFDAKPATDAPTSRPEAKAPSVDVATASQQEPTEVYETFTDAPNIDFLLTPSLPVYGTATAGPNGGLLLDEPDYTSALDESNRVQLEGLEYQVFSIKKGDSKINISPKNFITSVIPQKASEKFGGTRYGWLKVEGDSMNKASPYPIKNGDWVLFFATNAPEDKKIVIASEPIPESHETRLIVKRLVRANPFSGFLRSESNAKHKDISISEDYQLLGEVVAIAKEIKPVG